MTHWMVDTVVAAGAMFVTGIILGLTWRTILGVAVLVGLLAAPVTMRIEARQLAAQATRHDGDPDP